MAQTSIANPVWGYRVELDGQPIYFGIGREGRWTHVTRDWCHNRALRNVCRKHSDRVQIVPTDAAFSSRADAQHWERDMIAIFGRRDRGEGLLFNFTDGGDGISSADAVAENLRRVADGSHQFQGERNPMRRRKAAGVRHHAQDWKPWDRPQTTEKSAATWAMAGELYQFFLEHRHKEHIPWRWKLAIPSRDALRVIVKWFRADWKPEDDLNWSEWARAYRAQNRQEELG